MGISALGTASNAAKRNEGQIRRVAVGSYLTGARLVLRPLVSLRLDASEP